MGHISSHDRLSNFITSTLINIGPSVYHCGNRVAGIRPFLRHKIHYPFKFYTHVQDLDTSLKKYMKSGNITEKKNKTLKDV